MNVQETAETLQTAISSSLQGESSNSGVQVAEPVYEESKSKRNSKQQQQTTE